MTLVSPTRRRLLAAACLAPLGACTPFAPRNAAANGQLRVLTMEAPHHGVTPDPIPLHCFMPDGWSADGPVVVVMHGVNRDADRYARDWQPVAIAARALVICPEFSQRKFPGGAYYHLGGLLDAEGRPRPPASWHFPLIDAAFDLVRADVGGLRTRFALYGHSAGAQFVHRYLLFSRTDRTSMIVAANAGMYTMPDRSSPLPAGLANATLSDADLARAFSRPAIIALGDLDRDPNDEYLPTSAPAMAQGPHRHARGERFLSYAQQTANALGAPLRWQQMTVPGVGHSDAGMAPAAMRAILAADARSPS